MDIFEKCTKFTAAKEVMAAGYYPYFHRVESGQDPEVIIEGRKMIMAGSNNYLGLTSHPRLKTAVIKATLKYGVGCVGSRFLNGTLSLHEELEEALAKFMEKEKALIFSTGMQTNLGTISAMVGKDDMVITDKWDHASILDGCRLSYGKMLRFRHNDMEDLEKVLVGAEKDLGKLIVVDGVFSMEGDIANLPQIIRLGRKYGARIMVDDAHGLGVLGENGRGTAEHFGLEDQVDIIMGTFSKSFASIGGFVVGKEEVIHYLKHHARALIFSASLPPGCVASVMAALEVIKNQPQRRRRLWENARKLQEGLKSLGFDTGESQTPIIPVLIGNDMRAFQMWRKLFDHGIFTTPVVSPAVPENRALIRLNCMATHTSSHVEKILDVFEKVGKEMGIIPGSGKRMKEVNMEVRLKEWMKKIWRFSA